MILLGITGAIGHGKSTLLDALRHVQPESKTGESSAIISAAANYLNTTLQHMPELPRKADMHMVQAWLDKGLEPALRAVRSTTFTSEDIHFDPLDPDWHPELYEKLWRYLAAVADDPTLLSQAIGLNNKEQYRWLLQWLGGYVTIKLGWSLWHEELVHQAQVAKENGCKLYVVGGVRFPEDAKILKDAGGSLIEIIRPSLHQLDIDDPTERHRSQITPDARVHNSGSIDQLTALAVNLLHDIEMHKLAAVYDAHAY